MTTFARTLVAMAVPFAFGSVAAQDLPAVGSKVQGKVAVGRNTLVFPPGTWDVVWTGDATTGITGDGARSKVARLMAVQRDDAGQWRAMLYHASTLVTTAGIGNWNTTACERRNPLHMDFSGNFKFPECTFVDFLITPRNRPPETDPVYRALWDWSQQNKVKLPVSYLRVWYARYQGGDYVQTQVSVNPEAMGMPPAVVTDRETSEWNAAVLKGDPRRLAYVEELKKWSAELAANARTTVGGGSPKSDSLPPLPQAK
ncbi:hypothetical protein [Ramlibacter albus]|uniref:Uncharacterized protein n=1 Tax=Ramlibacter albus TaxID=2079448 RepID=A0A923MEL0_9BURK|nr:hypothetical protein [Ramlibacter albus]MBC5768073.1 hypothetical protein [Ramlibacter albus]